MLLEVKQVFTFIVSPHPQLKVKLFGNDSKIKKNMPAEMAELGGIGIENVIGSRQNLENIPFH